MVVLEKSAKISILPGKRGPKPKSTIEQIAAYEQQQRRVEMQTALTNPIRRQFGKQADSPWIYSALGRYCLVHNLREEIFRSGENYAKTRRKIISAWEGPLVDQPNGTGGDIDIETLKEWERNVKEWEESIMKSGMYGIGILSKIGILTFDDKDLPFHFMSEHIINGFLALAVSMGNLDKKALARA